MTDTDRTKLKKKQQGDLVSVGLSDPATAVAENNEGLVSFDLDADASQAERGYPCLRAFRVKAVYVLTASDLAAHASNYNTYVVQKRPSAALGTPVSVASFDTATGGSNISLTAWTKYSPTLTATDANRLFAVGDVLTFKATETGTPVSPLGRVLVKIEYI